MNEQPRAQEIGSAPEDRPAGAGQRPAEAAAGSARAPALTGLTAALLAASCCILPILLIVTGVAGAGLMMTMMRWEWLTLPAGVIGIGGAWFLYLRQRRRCQTAACEFVGRRSTLALLWIATLTVVVALTLRAFPGWTAALLATL